jgi:hypothetical protein
MKTVVELLSSMLDPLDNGDVLPAPARPLPTPADMPPGVGKEEWAECRRNLTRFVDEGWSARAVKLGWSKHQLFHVPSRPGFGRLGVAFLIGVDDKIVEMTEAAIAIETPRGATLRFDRRRR